jgi:O-antigen/teichoic acid export membrane protein
MVATFGRHLLAVVLGLVTAILIARILGPGGNGLYALALLLPTMLSTLLQLGIGVSVVYYVGRGSISASMARAAVLRLWFVLAAIGCALAGIVLSRWGERFAEVPPLLLWIGVGIFPIILLQVFLVALLQAKQDFRRYNLALLAGPVATLPFMILFLWVLDMGVTGALAAVVIGHGTALFVTWRAVGHHVGDAGSRRDLSGFIRSAVSYGWKVHLSNILTFLNYRADIFLVMYFLGAAPTGIYVIAVQLSEKLWILSHAVSTVLFPRLAELRQDEEQRKALTSLIARMVLFATGGATLLLALIAGPLIAVLFGPAYSGARAALLWLLPGIVLLSLSRVLAADIAARGRPEINMYTAIVTVVVNIASNIVLLPILGIVGAAMATTLSYSLSTIAKVYFYARLSGDSWWALFLPRRRDLELIRAVLAGRLRRDRGSRPAGSKRQQAPW